jgi:hypothetical protein
MVSNVYHIAYQDVLENGFAVLGCGWFRETTSATAPTTLCGVPVDPVIGQSDDWVLVVSPTFAVRQGILNNYRPCPTCSLLSLSNQDKV